jgi:hypothetical protein
MQSWRTTPPSSSPEVLQSIPAPEPRTRPEPEPAAAAKPAAERKPAHRKRAKAVKHADPAPRHETKRRAHSKAPARKVKPERPAASTAPAASGRTARILDAIASCESGGNPTATNGPYRGKYQFTRATWRALGGHGDPADASEATQDRLALKLYRRSGTAPWPSCG